MQATTLTAINGDLGSANKYHQEEIEETRNSNSPSSRYYLEEPETVFMFFDKGNILAPYKKKNDAPNNIESDLSAVEKALTDNLDVKSKNAVKKLQSNEFKQYRAEIVQLKKLIQDNETNGLLTEATIANKKKRLTSLQAKLASVKEPVIGRDFTLTLEKSYSIAFAVASKEEKQVWMNCYKKSCQDTLEMIIHEYMQSNSKKPFKKSELDDLTQKTVYGLYVHFTNRDGDPHLHAHGVIYNLLKELDSKRLKGNNFPIMQGPNFQRLVQKVDLFLHARKNEQLAEHLPNKYNFKEYKLSKEAGKHVKVDLAKEDTTADIAGWNIDFDEPSKKKIAQLSKLAKAVDEAVSEKLRIARESRDIYLSRAQRIEDKKIRQQEILQIKTEYKHYKKNVETDWRREYKGSIKQAKGVAQSDFESIAPELNLSTGTNYKAAGIDKFKADFAKLVQKATQNKHTFTEMEMEVFGLKYGADLKAIKQVIKQELNMARDNDGQRKYILHNGSWYSRSNLLIAMTIAYQSINLAKGEWGKKLQPLSQDGKRTLLEKLNKDQLKAIDLCLNDKQLNIIAGLPGVGKSTVLKVIVEETKKQSPRTEVFALSTSGKIVEQLAGDIANSQAKTLASFSQAIKSKSLQLTKDSLVIVDEAGMVEDEHYFTLLNEVKRAGAKVILVGDDRQLSSVGRGDSFREILRRNTKQTVRINEIVRQRNDLLKETVELMAGAGVSDEQYQKQVRSNELVKKTFEDLEKKKMVNSYTKSRELFDDIAKTYMRDPVAISEKIVIASSNNEVSKINNKIQDLRFKGSNTPSISLEDSDLSFFVGDRVMVTKQMNYKYQQEDPANPGQQITKTKKVSNGKLGTVLSVNPSKKTMVVEFENAGIKQLEEIDIEKKKDSIALGYASTVYKSQGVSVDSVYIALSDNEILNSAANLNVAISRGKQNCQVFMLGQHKEKIIQSHRENTKAQVDFENVKQKFFKDEYERRGLIKEQRKNQIPDPEIDQKIKDYITKLNELLLINGSDAIPVKAGLSKEVMKRFYGDEEKTHAFLTRLGSIRDLNRKLFGDIWTPEEVFTGHFPMSSVKVQSPQKEFGSMPNCMELDSQHRCVMRGRVWRILLPA